MESVMEEALQRLHSRFTEHRDITSFTYNQPQAESGVVAIQLSVAHLPFT